MSTFGTLDINYDYIKVRWEEPYVSAALNRKTFGVMPKGFYSGFTLAAGPGSRNLSIGAGVVPGNMGTGLTGGFQNGSFDDSSGFAIGVHQSTSGWQSTVSIPPGVLPMVIDATSATAGARAFVVLDVVYTLNAQTTAQFKVVSAAEIDANPSLLVIGYVDVPVSGATPFDSSMIGYNDATYPRVSPLASATKAGFMPAMDFTAINQLLARDQLLSSSVSGDYLIAISPSQGIGPNGQRMYSYVKATASSMFPRSAGGAYAGGPNNDQKTFLNVSTGAITGAHAIPGNTTFAVPPVGGSPNRFQVGIVAIDSTDQISVTYGSSQTSAALALLDANLPTVGGSMLQICAFLVQTDGVFGSLLPVTTVLDRRPYLNVGGGSASVYTAVVGNASDVTLGLATHSSVTGAIAATAAGGTIYLLPNRSWTEDVTISKGLGIYGAGRSSQITGNMSFVSGALSCTVKGIYLSGNLSFASVANRNLVTDCFQTDAATVTDSGTNNRYQIIGTASTFKSNMAVYI